MKHIKTYPLNEAQSMADVLQDRLQALEDAVESSKTLKKIFPDADFECTSLGATGHAGELMLTFYFKKTKDKPDEDISITVKIKKDKFILSLSHRKNVTKDPKTVRQPMMFKPIEVAELKQVVPEVIQFFKDYKKTNVIK